MAEVRVVRPDFGPRTRADLALLLDELNRLLRAFSVYQHGHPSRLKLLQRAFLLWQLELERGGSVEFGRTGKGFRSDEFGALECRYLGPLVRAMEIHQVDRVRVTRDLDQNGFARFASLLAVATADLDQLCEGRFAGRLYASSAPGIEINDRPREHSDPDCATAIPSPRAAAAAADESSARPAASQRAGPRVTIEPALAASFAATKRDTFAPQSAWPKLEEDPFEAPAMVMNGERLRLSLRELDRCDEDILYDTLVDRILASTRELWGAGQREEAYRALLVLTAHASGADAGSRPRALMAQSALESLVEREHLDFLIARARDCETGGVRPTQILLQLGERSTPALLDALNQESDPLRSTKLVGMLLALGEHAIPALSRAISQRRGSRLQLAVRLAGELQSPKLVPTLASVFLDSGPALRKEAGMALVNIGNLEACEVLVKALARDAEELARIAALCLGVLADDHATEPLLAALERATLRNRLRLARVVVCALGQLGGQQREITRALGSILESSGRTDRTERGRLKCAALEVLASYEGNQAQALLMSATRDDDPAVCRKAHEVMNERDRARTG